MDWCLPHRQIKRPGAARLGWNTSAMMDFNVMSVCTKNWYMIDL
jgi:hypothetical protein